MEFQTFNKDKVILKQGDQAYSFYFIVSGCVLVEVTEEDQSDHNLETRIMTELREGSSFGELALIHECKRRATIVSKEKSEFLVIHKEDYEVSSVDIGYSDNAGSRECWPNYHCNQYISISNKVCMEYHRREYLKPDKLSLHPISTVYCNAY